MQIADIASSYAASPLMQQSVVSNSTSTTNDFMLMLLAQLTNQNPLEPLKDSEMLSQFAQLNSVQELQTIHALMDQMASANQTGYAASLIGKTIRANLTSGKSLDGVVTGITMEAGKVYVHVGEEKALLSDVVEIKEK
jgi:flagellar basal-body rod modification protein FlgD